MRQNCRCPKGLGGASPSASSPTRLQTHEVCAFVVSSHPRLRRSKRWPRAFFRSLLVDERRFRLDFIIALGALLISTITALSSVYQTRVIARQFSAAVWPYVSFDQNFAPWQLQLYVRNDGLGPAILRSVSITWDGKPQPSLEQLLVTVARDQPYAMKAAHAALRAGAKLRITTSTPTAGMVIPANGQHTLIDMQGAVLVRYFHPDIKRLGLSLCYCSLTGNCWVQSFQNTGEPRTVPSCSTRA